MQQFSNMRCWPTWFVILILVWYFYHLKSVEVDDNWDFLFIRNAVYLTKKNLPFFESIIAWIESFLYLQWILFDRIKMVYSDVILISKVNCGEIELILMLNFQIKIFSAIKIVSKPYK